MGAGLRRSLGREEIGEDRRAPGGGAVALPAALGICAGAGAFALLASLIILVWGHTQGVQFSLYALGFVLAVPATLAGAHGWERLRRELGEEAASGAIGAAAAALALALVAARGLAGVADLSPPALAAAAFGAWCLAVGGCIVRPAALPRDLLAARRELLWRLAVLALALALPAFAVAPRSISVVAAACVALAAGLAIALGPRLPRLPRPAGVAVDVIALVVIALAAVDVVAYIGADLGTLIRLPIHQDFLLAPANDVLQGRAMLTEGVVSQYGVGSIYALTGWFLVAPIGYGTLSLLNGILLGLAWGAVYGLLRLTGGGRAVAACVVAVGLLATVVSIYPYPVSWPQIGPLRFGLPLLIALLETLAARAPGFRGWRAASIGTLALASVWSVETFVYAAATFGAVQVWLAVTEPGGWRPVGRRLAVAAAACVGAHALLAAITLVATGELPDWGLYLALTRHQSTTQYLPGYLFGAWPLGAAVGLAYLASAVGLATIAMRRRELQAAHPAVLVALVGTTVYGASSLSYGVGRAPSLPYVLIGGFAMAGVWLNFALRAGLPQWRRPSLAFGAWCAVLVVGFSAGSVSVGWDRTALAHLLPGGDSLGEAVSDLWGSPPLDFRSPEAVRLLDENLAEGEPALVIAGPDLGVETLVRSGRANVLPVSYEPQDDVLRSRFAPEVAATIAELEPGTLLLTQRTLLDAELPADPLAELNHLDQQPVPLQLYALKLIEDRFDLDVVARSGDLVLVELR